MNNHVTYFLAMFLFALVLTGCGRPYHRYARDGYRGYDYDRRIHQYYKDNNDRDYYCYNRYLHRREKDRNRNQGRECYKDRDDDQHRGESHDDD